jgi:hypothetical protein
MGVRWCVAVLLLAGCTETVPLGWECPNQLDSCIDAATDAGTRAPAPSSGPVAIAPPALDGGSARPPPVDARTDAAAAEPGTFPELENISFDSPGEIGSLTQADLVPPWNACGFSWRVIDRVLVDRTNGSTLEVRATDRSMFIEYVFSPQDPDDENSEPTRGWIDQRLPEPLAPGRYSIRLDVLASSGNVVVELWSGATCTPTRLLGATGRVTPGRWQSMCLSFEVPSDAPADGLMLQISARDLDRMGTRVFLDNLREDASCR